MSFPFLFHENFEKGTRGGFTDDFDPLGRLDFPDHNDDLGIPPWRGGYVMRVDLDRGYDQAAYVEQNAVLNMIQGETRYLRFYLRFSDDFKIPSGAGNSVKILTMYSGGGSNLEEFAIGVTRSDSQILTPGLSIWSPDDNEFMEGLAFKRGKWVPVQVTIFNHLTDGRVYLHVGENTVQVGRLVLQPFTHFRLGVHAQSPKLRGTLYYDDFIISTTKLENQADIEPDDLWGQSILYTKSSYAFVGPGSIRGATLIGGGSNNLAYLYDADRLPIAHHDARAALKVAAAESKDILVEDIKFHRGCYIEMTGTNPQVIIHYGVKG